MSAEEISKSVTLPTHRPPTAWMSSVSSSPCYRGETTPDKSTARRCFAERGEAFSIFSYCDSEGHQGFLPLSIRCASLHLSQAPTLTFSGLFPNGLFSSTFQGRVADSRCSTLLLQSASTHRPWRLEPQLHSYSSLHMPLDWLTQLPPG